MFVFTFVLLLVLNLLYLTMAAALAELNNILTQIGFAAAGAAVTVQGIQALDDLRDMSDDNITTLCLLVCHPGGTVADAAGNQVPHCGTALSATLEICLKLASYYLIHLQRTQRDFVLNAAMVAWLNQMKVLHHHEKTICEKQTEYKKPPKFTKITKASRLNSNLD